MTKNIELFLKDKQKIVAVLKPQPIIVRWLKSPRMEQSLTIIDRHVAYLLNHRTFGGMVKLNQWFLSGDENFNAITAERYMIHYLQQKNANVVDNLRKSGIDAYFKWEDGLIGIEITTLNGFIAEWILVERLKQLLDENGFLLDKGLDVAYSHKRISSAAKGGTIYDYIDKAGKAIMLKDYQMMSELEFEIEINDRSPGLISFHHTREGNSFPWFKYITDDLWSKLKEKNKSKQLKEYSRNLVFVGINHLSPCNGAFPFIFEDLGKDEIHYPSEIQEIRKFWTSCMSSLDNVVGICYFFYSLDKEIPFYPLKVFWCSNNNKITINL